MSKQTTYDKVKLLGVDVDVVSNTDAVSYICDLAAPGKPAAYVIKPYVEFLDKAGKDPKTRKLLNNAELSVADGVALVWAAHFLFAGPRSAWRFWLTLFQIPLSPQKLSWPLPDRAAGTNFTWPMLEEAAGRGLKIFLVGKQTEAEIEEVAKVINKRLPKANICGTMSGIDSSSDYGAVSDAWLGQARGRISHAEADLVLVGMGFPLQERVCAYLADNSDHGVFIGEGGTFDYDSFGGTKRKAPEWVQRIGVEWLWRLVLQPKRLVRQLAVPRFMHRIWINR